VFSLLSFYIIYIGTFLFQKTLIPNNVPIGSSAFYKCSALKSVKLNENLTTIDYRAFYDCTNLNNIELPDSVTYIGDQAFSNCASLETINVPAGIQNLTNWAFRDITGLKTIYIPSTVDFIGSDAFKGCTNLSDISIENGVEYIEVNAFADTAYYADKSNWDNGVLYIDNYLIASKPQEMQSTVYAVKEGTCLIANRALYGCEQILEKCIIPDSVIYINTEVIGALPLNKNFNVYYYGTEEKWKTEVVFYSNSAIYRSLKIGAMEGDLNADTEINARDSLLMKRYLVGSLDSSNLADHTLDVNGDGKFNAKDSFAIKKMLAA